MPDGKPAGVPCIQLDEQRRCKLYGLPERPLVCVQFSPDEAVCGESREQAMRWMGWPAAHAASGFATEAEAVVQSERQHQGMELAGARIGA